MDQFSIFQGLIAALAFKVIADDLNHTVVVLHPMCIPCCTYYVCAAVPRCKGVCHRLQGLPQWYDEYHTATWCMYRHSVSVRVSV